MTNLSRGQIVALKCLGTIEGPRFLDGRTKDGTTGLAPSTEPPFSGTKWVVDGSEGRFVLWCLGDVDGPRALDGRTGNGTVGLAPNTDAPFSGTAWEVVDNGSSISLKCLGQTEGPRFLDGRTKDGTTGLAPNTEPPFTGTRWEVINLGTVQAELHFDVNSIVFDGGVPVGGNAHLTLRQDGSVNFSGHFHDSGFPSYNVSCVFGVKDAGGRLYTFQTSGHLAGTDEAGSRDYDWNINSNNGLIAHNWPAIAGKAIGKCDSRADWDIKVLIDDIKQAVGYVGQVIAIIGAVA